MTSLLDLLDDEKVAALKEVAAKAGTPEAAERLLGHQTMTQAEHDDGVRTQLSAFAVVIPEGEGAFLTTCICGEEIRVRRDVPGSVDAKRPRVPMCADCAKDVVTGRAHVVIHRPQVAKRKPRLTDGQDHPVTVTSTNTQENDMHLDLDANLDLETIPDAKLGRMVKDGLRKDKAKNLPKKNAKAKTKAAKKEKVQVKAKKAERKDLSDLVLPEIVVSATLSIPALDLSTINSLDEVVNATTRSPYNKARFGGGIGPKESLDTKETTWADLAEEHRRIGAIVAGKGEAKPTKQAKPAKSKKLLAAEVDVDARLATLMATCKVSRKVAKRMLAEIA